MTSPTKQLPLSSLNLWAIVQVHETPKQQKVVGILGNLDLAQDHAQSLSKILSRHTTGIQFKVVGISNLKEI